MAGAAGESYVAVPSSGTAWPGVVVIHDISGMSNEIRAQADWLASEGFLAVAPDLYAHGSKPRCVAGALRDAALRTGRTFDELEEARNYLAERADCTGKIGVVGYCLGGSFALMLAAGGDYGAASVNYGNVPLDSRRLLRDACPIVASFGGKDYPLRYAPAVLEDALSANGIEFDLAVYPDAGHAFLNDLSPAAESTGLKGKIAHLTGTHFDSPSATDARRRIVAFFTTHLT